MQLTENKRTEKEKSNKTINIIAYSQNKKTNFECAQLQHFLRKSDKKRKKIKASSNSYIPRCCHVVKKNVVRYTVGHWQKRNPSKEILGLFKLTFLIVKLT